MVHTNYPPHVTATFSIGDIVISGCIFEVNSAYTDPTIVQCKVRAPDGGTTTYGLADPELTQLGVGMYQLEIEPDQAGEWWVRWIGDAPAQGEQEGVFYVREKNVS